MVVEQTLIVVKPDGIRRQLAGRILARFEEKGYQIKNIKSFNFSIEEAREFYAPHRDKAFFNDLVKFISSGLVLACILEGTNAVNTVRLMVGATKSFEAAPGTIRGDLGIGLTDNVIHASDSYESFIKESRVIFDRIS
ncbi:MAG TPA: nucleoside-diphosphate kinase [Candidatus Nitrosopolaris sp.]|nr:nucleoside-diphosphate kinase [Candidatus Nitrosopolaris sp.]